MKKKEYLLIVIALLGFGPLLFLMVREIYKEDKKEAETTIYSKPAPYQPSPKVQAKIDSTLLMIKYMGSRDSFYFASIEAYVRESDRLGNRLKDSADMYSKRIKSFSKH